MNHEILSRLTFPAPAAAALKIASPSAFQTRVGCVSNHTQFRHSPHKNQRCASIEFKKKMYPLRLVTR